MRNTAYYSQRHNEGLVKLDLPELRKKFLKIYNYFQSKSWFQEYLGEYQNLENFENIHYEGYYGANIADFIELNTGKNEIWPIPYKCRDYTEPQLFDAIEFLFDAVSFPTKIDWVNGSFYKYKEFDKKGGEDSYRELVNKSLARYKDGYQLNEKGEIEHLDQAENKLLMDELETLTVSKPEKHLDIVKQAQSLFNNRNSDTQSKMQAVRLVADALEFIRPLLEGNLLTKDENDLFEILNRFGIRHNQQQQKSDYDKDIYAPWLFYYFVNAYIHCIKILQSKGVAV